jgi:hypothetical protein
MTATPSVDRAASRLVAGLEHAWPPSAATILRSPRSWSWSPRAATPAAGD